MQSMECVKESMHMSESNTFNENVLEITSFFKTKKKSKNVYERNEKAFLHS